MALIFMIKHAVILPYMLHCIKNALKRIFTSKISIKLHLKIMEMIGMKLKATQTSITILIPIIIKDIKFSKEI